MIFTTEERTVASCFSCRSPHFGVFFLPKIALYHRDSPVGVVHFGVFFLPQIASIPSGVSPHAPMASKIRKFRSESPCSRGLKNAVFRMPHMRASSSSFLASKNVIEFMLPKRSACASRFWKLGYLSNSISFSLLPGRPILFSPPPWHGLKTRNFSFQTPSWHGLKTVISTPNPKYRLVLATYYSV